ncbi:MAG: class I SAM-dependent methyltransferase, partial [Acidimicrobiia bacterium]|nr:class I SAM-dependent methyltransferase [Acidimicrobiia bacterium]
RTYAEGKKIGWRDGVQALSCIVRYSPPGRRLRAALVREPSPANLADADDALAGVLEPMDQARNYADWIAAMIRPWLGEKVMEVGAGDGTLSERMAPHCSLVATDPSARSVAALRQRFAADPSVTVDVGLLDDVADRHTVDTYVLVNVLEHIPDDVAALRLMGERLPNGGHIVLYVPAMAMLYSAFDASIGHYRRYTKRSLLGACAAAGLRVDTIHHVNAPGALAWLLSARVAGLEPTRRAGVVAYDRAVVPVVRRIESSWRPPLGQSLFCVASLPGEP